MSTTRTLLIDADDTLWENNIYFEQVTAEFVATLGRRGHKPERVDQLLWETEQRNVKITGNSARRNSSCGFRSRKTGSSIVQSNCCPVCAKHFPGSRRSII